MKARLRIALLASCLFALAMTSKAGALGLQPIGNFDRPIFITAPPGDPRIFVAERPGYIEVVHDGTTSRFLDIHDRTTTDGERGLLSMAFDPNYASNGLVYVLYTGTAANDGQTGLGHVDEFHVSANPDAADPASRRPVLTISRPSSGASNHNGGQLQFGKDGLLYVSVGDGGTGGSTAPDLSVLNGKVLRIDPHGPTAGAYSIPADNPFVSSGSARGEIWSSGFRNPWRFSFDALNGDVVIGDVGEATWEEVDFAPTSIGLGRGANFGWPSCEGFNDKGTGTPCTASGVTAPVFAYPHSNPGGDQAHGCAIMGGYVYRGTQMPEVAGRYLYADLCTGELRSIQLGLPLASGDRAESAPGALDGPWSFGQDASCELYVTDGDNVDRITGSRTGAVVPSCPASPASPAQPIAKRKCKKRHHKKHRAAEAKKHKHKKKRCKKKRHKKRH